MKHRFSSSLLVTLLALSIGLSAQQPNPNKVAVLHWYSANKVTSFVQKTGASPIALAYDGTNMWVVNNGNGTVSVVGTNDGQVLTDSGGVVATYAVGNSGSSHPEQIAYDGSNMWVTAAEGTVTKIPVSNVRKGTSTRTVVSGFPTGSSLTGVVFDGTSVWVSNTPLNMLYQINPHTNTYTTVTTVGHGPNYLAFDGTDLWVSDGGSAQVEAIGPPPNGGYLQNFGSLNPGAIAFDGVNIWVGLGGGAMYGASVTIIPITAPSSWSTASVPGMAVTGMAFDANNMWVSTAAGGAYELDYTGAVISSPPVQPGNAGMAFDGAHIWVACQGGGPGGYLSKL